MTRINIQSGKHMNRIEKPTVSKRRPKEHRLYKPLNWVKKQIRLLQIDTSGTDSEGRIRCQLRYCFLTSRREPLYEAVSWCWGDTTKRKEILLNGQAVKIPANAEEVIRRVCIDHGHKLVWLDAVCINQSDISERGHQVSIMGDIYSQAQRVLIWLGEDNGTARRAVKSIRMLVDQCKEVAMHSVGYARDHWDVCDPQWQIDVLRKIRKDEIDGAFQDLTCDWSSLTTFFSAAWWTRLWVVQEAVLSKEALCYHGDVSIPWSEVGHAAAWLEIHPESQRQIRNPKFPLDYDTMIGIMNASTMWEFKNTKILLSTYLYRIVDFDTSDPLDKVYGLFGLLQRSDWAGYISDDLLPNYNKKPNTVLTAMARVCIKADLDWAKPGEALDVLEYARAFVPPADKCDAGGQPQDRSPSWVPRYDWRFDNAQCLSKHQWYLASGRQLVRMEHVDASPDVLRIRGISVDSIQRCGPVLTKDVLAQPTSVADAVRSCLSIVSESTVTPGEFGITLMSGVPDPNQIYGAAKHNLDDIGGRFQLFRKRCDHIVSQAQKINEGQLKDDAAFESYVDVIRASTKDRRLFVTGNRYIGSGPPDMQEGDYVVLLFGGRVPFVLRQVGEHWILIGTAYVNGIMEGEYVENFDAEALKTESMWFDIR